MNINLAVAVTDDDWVQLLRAQPGSKVAGPATGAQELQ